VLKIKAAGFFGGSSCRPSTILTADAWGLTDE